MICGCKNSSSSTAYNRVDDQKTWYGPQSHTSGAGASPKSLEKVAYPQFATELFWAQNPDCQPSKVYLSHNKSSATSALFIGKISQGPLPDF